MGIVLALLFYSAVGGVCCYRSRAWLEARGERVGIPFIIPSAVVFLVGAPATIYLFRFHSVFFFHYLWDPARDPIFDTYSFIISVGIMALLALATLGGYVAVRKTVALMHPPYCLAPSAGMALLWALLAGIFYRRAFYLGTMEAFDSDTTLPMAGLPLAALVAPFVAALIATFLAGRLFREEVRATSTPPT
jgi:hypothetical protein